MRKKSFFDFSKCVGGEKAFQKIHHALIAESPLRNQASLGFNRFEQNFTAHHKADLKLLIKMTFQCS